MEILLRLIDDEVANFIAPLVFALMSLIELPPHVSQKLIEAQVQIGIGVLRGNGIRAKYDRLLFDETNSEINLVGLEMEIPINEFCDPEVIFDDYWKNPKLWSDPCVANLRVESAKIFSISNLNKSNGTKFSLFAKNVSFDTQNFNLPQANLMKKLLEIDEAILKANLMANFVYDFPSDKSDISLGLDIQDFGKISLGGSLANLIIMESTEHFKADLIRTDFYFHNGKVLQIVENLIGLQNNENINLSEEVDKIFHGTDLEKKKYYPELSQNLANFKTFLRDKKSILCYRRTSHPISSRLLQELVYSPILYLATFCEFTILSPQVSFDSEFDIILPSKIDG